MPLTQAPLHLTLQFPWRGRHIVSGHDPERDDSIFFPDHCLLLGEEPGPAHTWHLNTSEAEVHGGRSSFLKPRSSPILPPHPGPPHMSGVSMKGSGDASDLTDASELWGWEAEAQSSGFQTTEGFMSCCWDMSIGKDHQHSLNQASSGRWEVTGSGSLTTEGCASHLPPLSFPAPTPQGGVRGGG